MLSAKLPFESAVLQFNGTILPCLLTCTSHIFTNPESTFFLQILPCFSTNTFEEFSIKIKIEKNAHTTVYFSKKRQTLKTQQEKLREENS